MRDFLFLKNNAKCLKIFLDDLRYIEAADKYVRFVTVQKTIMVLGCLSRVETKLPTDQFCRIHRSYIVSFRHTDEFTNETVLIGDLNLPLAKQYKAAFFERAEIIYAGSSQLHIG
jgi:two-component system, LytTR family, response regulator